MVATWATLCWRETETVQSTPVFDSCKRSLAPVYTHLNYFPTSNHSYQLWLKIENNVTGWLISSGSGASALCTGELHMHSLVGTQWTSFGRRPRLYGNSGIPFLFCSNILDGLFQLKGTKTTTWILLTWTSHSSILRALLLFWTHLVSVTILAPHSVRLHAQSSRNTVIAWLIYSNWTNAHVPVCENKRGINFWPQNIPDSYTINGNMPSFGLLVLELFLVSPLLRKPRNWHRN